MKPPLSTIPPDVVSVADYEALACERVAPATWAYLQGGAADEITLRSNRAAYDAIRLHGRVLSDMRGAHTRLELFGHIFAHPILLAPVAQQQLFHPEGERATAFGAAAMNAGMVLSAQANTRLEDVAAIASSPLWMQVYMQVERAETLTLVRRAEAAGYQAIVLTVDAPVNGVRNREQRAGFRGGEGVGLVNLAGMASATPRSVALGGSPVFGSGLLDVAPTWHDIEWLRSETHLPIVLKGIVSPDDAARAVDARLDGIIVSNHGGRTLDTLPSSLDALRRIADALEAQIPLLVDGGVRRGTDILAALACGARAVLIGRPYAWGLAAAGAAGVAHVLNILLAELEMAMTLTGCPRVDAASKALLWEHPTQGASR